MQTPVCHATIYPILLCAHAAILKVVRWTTTCAWPQGGCCRIRYGPKTSRNSAGGGQPPQRSPDRGRRRARVRCAGDRPADDQKVGTGGERLLRRREPRLILGLRAGRANPGRDQGYLRPDLGQGVGTLTRG